MSHIDKPKIYSIAQVFQENPNLEIPDYQRPYKWTEYNVQQLLDDIVLNSDVSEYRLGTVVLHKNKGQNEADVLHIVDGQQRLTTISLILQALKERSFEDSKVYDRYKHISSNLLVSITEHPDSQYNLWKNYQRIKDIVRSFSDEIIEFFFDNCKVVWVEIKDVSEAFQFFDSQNSRGKDLDPHDLLKAFHLREMTDESEENTLNSVDSWERMNQVELAHLFNDYLFRVRNWSKGRRAKFFTKGEVDLFKGISLTSRENYNFIQPYRINHFFTEKYNNDMERKIDGQKMNYPFQLDQIVINGRRFFEFVGYYSEIIDGIKDTHDLGEKFEKNEIVRYVKGGKSHAYAILETLAKYPGRNRTGDRYVRNVFDCCLMYYQDKFGLEMIDKAIEKFFIWAYRERLVKSAVQLASIDNLGIGMESQSIFRVIREAKDVKEVLHTPLEGAGTARLKNLDEIVTLFKKLNYWTGK